MERLAITITIVFVARAISARVDEAVLEPRATRPQPTYQQQLPRLLPAESLARKPPTTLLQPARDSRPRATRSDLPPTLKTRLGNTLDLPPATRQRLAGAALAIGPKGTSETPANRRPPRPKRSKLASEQPASRQPAHDLPSTRVREPSRTRLEPVRDPVREPSTDCQTECTTPISNGENPQTVCGKSICTACSICAGGFPIAHGTPIIAADTDCAKECITPISKGADVKAVCSKRSCVDCAICSLDDVKPVFTDCAEMYREQQDKQKCGLHAVNNVIMNSIALPNSSRLMKESEMRLIAAGLLMPASPEGGFDYSVVFSALERRFKGSDVDINIVGGTLDGGFVPKTIEEHMAGLAESNASARRLGRGIAMSLDNAGWVVVNDANRGHYYTYFRLNDYTFCNLDSVIQHNISGRVLPAREILQCELETLTFAAIIFPSPIPGIARRSRQVTPVFTEIRPLVEMGFSSDDSCKAYMKAGGNLRLATDMLLGS